MKVIFLDFDGVIATADSYARAVDESDEEDRSNWQYGFPQGVNLIDTQMVERLQTICEATGASIVISSTWRRLHDLDEIVDMLRHHGLKADVIDTTPMKLSHISRGAAIMMWIERFEGKLDGFLILDDDEEVGYEDFLFDHWIQTMWDGPNPGIQPEHIEQAIQILGEK